MAVIKPVIYRLQRCDKNKNHLTSIFSFSSVISKPEIPPFTLACSANETIDLFVFN